MATAKRIRCIKCKKTTCFIPLGYELNIDITCPECHTGKKKKKTKTVKTATANYARSKKGVREDIHPTYSFRSPTEANVARIFNYLGATWTFEERSFTFEGYKNAPHVYIMYFQIDKIDHRKKNPEWLTECFVEVKGWMDSKSRERLRRLKRQYPEDAKNTLVILYSHYDKKATTFCEKLGYRYIYYDYLTKEYKDKIPNWESKDDKDN